MTRSCYNFGKTLLLAMANIAELEGVKAPFLHVNQLIANKKAVNRPKGQVDVLYLERIKTILDKRADK